MSDIFENKGAFGATIIVAASDSLKNRSANYVCDGTADNVEIVAAINALPATGGEIVVNHYGVMFRRDKLGVVTP